MPIHKPFQRKKFGSKLQSYKSMKKQSSIPIESPKQIETKFKIAKMISEHEAQKANPSKMVMLLHHH